VEFHRLYVGAITGAGRAILASRTSASGNNDRAVMEGRDDQATKSEVHYQIGMAVAVNHSRTMRNTADIIAQIPNTKERVRK